MCIDAPGYTTNSLSSGSILDGERTQHFSEGEKKVDLCFSFNFKFFLVSFYAASRTHRSRLPEIDPQILERSGCADEVLLGKIKNRRWFLVSTVGLTQYGFGESNSSDWFRHA